MIHAAPQRELLHNKPCSPTSLHGLSHGPCPQCLVNRDPGHPLHPQGPGQAGGAGACPQPAGCSTGSVQRAHTMHVVGRRGCFQQKPLNSNDILRLYGCKTFLSTMTLQFSSYKIPAKSPWWKDLVMGFEIGKKNHGLILGFTHAQVWWTAVRMDLHGLRSQWITMLIFSYT